MSSKISIEKVSDLQAIDNDSTDYSVSSRFKDCAGNAAIVLISTAGSITVSQQISMDNVTFYDPVDTSGTPLGVLATDQTVTTGKYIAFTPVLCPYTRFKIVAADSAATVLTIKLIFRKEV